MIHNLWDDPVFVAKIFSYDPSFNLIVRKISQVIEKSREYHPITIMMIDNTPAVSNIYCNKAKKLS